MAETKKKTTHKDNFIGNILTSKTTHKANKKKVGPYGGKYDDIMEGEHLIAMREAIEKLAAGKMSKKEYLKWKEGFLNEFPESAIALLKKDIARDAKKHLRK